jgi:hypothetical protein
MAVLNRLGFAIQEHPNTVNPTAEVREAMNKEGICGVQLINSAENDHNRIAK